MLEETWSIIESFDKKGSDNNAQNNSTSQSQESEAKATKRTFDEEQSEDTAIKKAKKDDDNDADAEKGEKFNWLEVIKSELQDKGEMKLKKLQKKVKV